MLFEIELFQSRTGIGNSSAYFGGSSSRRACYMTHQKRTCFHLPLGEAHNLMKRVPGRAQNYAASRQGTTRLD
jgi:hypothetical protein